MKPTHPLIVLALSLGPACALASGLYSLTDLGSLDGTTSFGASVNDSGQVAGFSSFGNGISRAFFYSGGTMTNLGLIGHGFNNSSVATGINDSGQVTGESEVDGTNHAFIWSSGSFNDLGAFGGKATIATGINNAGQVSAYAQGADNVDQALLFSSGVMHYLGLPVSTTGGINASGEVVGIDRSNQTIAFSYAGGNINEFGTLPGFFHSGATGVNDAGQVIGWSEPFGGLDHAFLYSPKGTLADLGVFNALGINNSDQIVGSESILEQNHAVLYSGGSLTDLNFDLNSTGNGYFLTDADGISNTGFIVANAIAPNGFSHAVLLTPAAVPEPTTVAALLTGLTAVMRRRKRS